MSGGAGVKVWLRHVIGPKCVRQEVLASEYGPGMLLGVDVCVGKSWPISMAQVQSNASSQAVPAT
eukprot:scaffold167167_cov17-Tisochrysis_lutea.AAC.1